MTLARITGSTFRGGLLRGVVAGAVAVLVVYGVLALTPGEQTATAQEPCARGTAVPNPAANPGLVSDCAVLLAVKDTLRGTETLNWSAETAIADWSGVTVDGEPPRVVSLDLEGAGLNGTIPARLGELAALRTLALQDNALTGTIPARLGDLERLERLRLQGNALTGAIPAELGSLAALQLLYLQGNQLTGEIPRALAALANLVALDLNSNRLTGSIPAELGELWSLRDLYLEHNQLSGQIPEVLEDRSLRSLYLAGNRGLTGCLPQGLRGVAFTDVTALGLPACAPRPAFTLTTSVTSGGTITPAPGRHTYGRNARVRVRATAAGWDIELQSWGGACARTPLTETDCIVTMDADKTVSVAFERAMHTLTVEATAGGSVSPEGTTTHFARRDVAVTVTATPDPGYRVASWGGDCSASGANLTCEVTMDGDRTVSVAFEEGTAYALTVTAGANGDVSPAPGTSTHHEDAQVTLTAVPDAGYRVASWGADCAASGTNLTCVLTMDGDRTAAVTFEEGTAHALTTMAGEGGSITPAGTTTHHEGAGVTLTATWDDATHSFSRWGGDCSASGTASTCVLTMDADKTVTATFAALPADRCATTAATDCIRAVYRGAPDDYAQVQDIPAGVLLTPNSDGRYYVERGRQYTVVTAAPLPEGWSRFYLRTPLGTPAPVSASQLIPPVGTAYTFTVTTDPGAATLITYDLKRARPFVRPRPDGKPEIGATVVTTVFSVETDTLSYNIYDTTGAVTTPGSYAFLSDPDAPSTAVTTYEALRDGTTTALLIHTSDAHGASQAALYDTVEAGDLFEWRQADDCFVRYTVTEVKPDPTGTVPRKLLGVEWMTYAFTGCKGAVMPDAAVSTIWGPLPDLGGTSLTVPIRHGAVQIVPAGWTGEVEEEERREAPRSSAYVQTSDLAVARTLDFWREPTLPEGWTLASASAGGPTDASYGFCSVYVTPEGYIGVRICGGWATGVGNTADASWTPSLGGGRVGLSVRETRVISGRTATVTYSPQGPGHNELAAINVWVYSERSGLVYAVYGAARGSNVEAAIAIAQSLFESPNQP